MTVGVTHHAQTQLGDVVMVDHQLNAGATLEAEAAVATVESVKAVAEIYCPLRGELLTFNEALDAEPELINTDPYGEGWILKIRPANPGDLDSLMDAAAYAEYIAG